MGEEQGGVDFEAGVLLEGVPFEHYRRAPGINASGLKTILRSPAHWVYERDVAPRKETPAMRFGTLLHAAVLEPERFEQRLAVAPEFNLRSAQGKANAAAWRAELPQGAIEASAAEHEAIQGVLASVRAHRMLCRLLARGKRETCLFWDDEEHNVAAKARFDFVAEGTGIIVDLKTTLDARPDAFGRVAIAQQYALSAAHYLAGAEATQVACADRFVLVAIERDPPFGIRLYEISQEELARGRGWRNLAMKSYAACVASGRWPGYPQNFEQLCPPGWAPHAVDTGDDNF